MMFVILTYDVGVKRVAKTLKICRKYLNHVQKSVFEGMITEGKLGQLKRELKNTVKESEDSVRIYRVENIKYTSLEEIGGNGEQDNIL